ncbi:DUF3352 domain-containing protein [Chroococcidiopsis sp. FACHB-1243]|uniref:DUF3352 domain-containing protein n=1 Tax=Chroococcidiopsis sp. [FACHB-1243] TaxID=2692781 RepID=UPI00177D9F72|nr:DUF3352 domain-containing protein [Chroococcidiopsis sp. [FACHB-1243]]MBD2305177.1 DUF3352 domain-containing protein [Chroococcidiopsis sp. [FACHB-1243]]
MKRSLFFSAIATAVVVLLLIGVGGFYWINAQSPLSLLRGGTTNTPAAAIFVPKQAPAMVSLLVNPEKLESLRQLAARPSDRRQSRQELERFKSSLLASSSLDYRQDIQPWLGEEVTLALTSPDIDRDATNGNQPGYLMVLTSRNSVKSREFLQLLFSQRAIAGRDLVSETYQGVNIFSDRNRVNVGAHSRAPLQEQISLVGAAVGDRFILFANHPKVLREAINNVQAPDLSLNDSAQYQHALSLLPTERIGVIFLNLPQVTTLLGKEPQEQIYDSQIIALKLNPQGIVAETSITANQTELAPAGKMLSEPVQALQYLPTTTNLAIAGLDLSHLQNTNLNQLWRQITTVLSGSSNDAISRSIAQPLAKLQDSWGIDISQDIFSWVQGEYALGMLPQKDASTSADWIFIAEKSEGTDLAIDRFNTIAENRGLSITPLFSNEQKIYAWMQVNPVPSSPSELGDRSLLTLKAKVQGVYTTIDKYEIFTSSVAAMEAALKAAKTNSLLKSSQFQSAIKAIPQPNQGYLYLNLPRSREILERQLPLVKLLEVAAKPFFDKTQSITVSSYGDRTDVLQGSIVLRLGSN